ncbi:MAG TPA: sugar ABC transporter substrate-binding protein [Ensifer sp.]|jgi:inositol transport system substrate-binding protein|uniref:sugar ABC transporter substrate-binding protein n=1 Tax=Ensifer sp. TaxID=1872086 RepID=UPI002E0EB7E5|nr:sugar ABC transporter substrate-binding protein [Ensifer sp.]
MKSLLAGLLLSTTLMTTANAANIGVAMSNFDDNFLTILRLSMQKAVEGKSDIELQFEDAQTDIGKQLDQVNNFVAQGVDAIIVNPVDASATQPITAAATAAGIPLIYVNRQPVEKLPESGVSFVGSNEYEAGTLQMTEVCRLLGGKGKVNIIMGDLAYEAARVRTQAAEDVLKKPECSGITVAEKQAGKWTRISGTDLVTNWLSAGMDVNAIIANNDEMALGAVQALKGVNKELGAGEGKIVVGGIDATQDAMKAMKSGDLAVSVFQDAAGQGKGAVDTALKMIAKEPVEQNVWIPFELVTPANLSSYESRN